MIVSDLLSILTFHTWIHSLVLSAPPRAGFICEFLLEQTLYTISHVVWGFTFVIQFSHTNHFVSFVLTAGIATWSVQLDIDVFHTNVNPPSKHGSGIGVFCSGAKLFEDSEI